jgi:hypothetical protein
VFWCTDEATAHLIQYTEGVSSVPPVLEAQCWKWAEGAEIAGKGCVRGL